MNVRYVNHQGESISLDDDKIILQYQELYDYSWDTESKNGKITGFYRENATIPISVSVTADTEEEYLKILNDFFTVTEKDIMTLRNGKLYLGNQYLSCFISGSIKEDAFMGVPFQIKNLTLITDHPFWITETEYTFKVQNITSSSNKKYPLKYPFRYANGMDNAYVINPNFTDSNFVLRVYGPVVNPQVNIGGHPYLVNTILETGEYLEINSMNGTIVKTMMNGIKVSIFHARAKGAKSVFKKISAGRQEITWPGTFNFDLIVYEERSEPKWNW